MYQEKFEQFTIYHSDVSRSFVFADFNSPDLFMDGFSDYLLNETNLLNYANSASPIPFEPTAAHYKKAYSTLESFLNSETELLSFDSVSQTVMDVLGKEYRFIDKNGKVYVQNDKIGKIGEYAFHVLMSRYFQLNCIIPKFRCATDRNMSVFGIDALFFDPNERIIYFGESKFCSNIENAITLINRSFIDYEEQISEEYKLVLSNSEAFRLSPEFLDAFQHHTDICISFQDFVKQASIMTICIPAFLMHGNANNIDTPESFLNKMNKELTRRTFFNLDTKYLFISLPIIDKNRLLDNIMRKVVKKSNEYKAELSQV